MNPTAVANLLYYQLKPWLPRRLAIESRRRLAAWKKRRHRATWPIDEASARPPESWSGWPDDKPFALVLTHDVESEKGRDRSLELAGLEQEYGFRSSFNFVPKRYQVGARLRYKLQNLGFEVGVHGLYHDGKLFRSRKSFLKRVSEINYYLRLWKASGFRSPAMHHNLHWINDLAIDYDSSTFDTDPFEPQPDGVGTVFPFLVGIPGQQSYVELPYTMPQDFTLFVLMKETSISIWQRKLDWLASVGGMVLINTHPDYMAFGRQRPAREEYPVVLYLDLLNYIQNRYQGCYWHVTPLKVARFFKEQAQKSAQSTFVGNLAYAREQQRASS